MFDIDKWQEIFTTIKQNKLRTFLTGFSVAWGIFILIVLLGAGNGLRTGAESQFMGDAINSVFIGGGTTTIPYNGLQNGRQIILKTEDFYLIRQKIKKLEYISAIKGGSEVNMIYNNKSALFSIRACMPDNIYLENASMLSGRFINDKDIQEYRKVCIIGAPVRDELFKDEDPINKFIDAGGISYKVVGVFKDLGRNDENRIYVPLSTFQRISSGSQALDYIWASYENNMLENTEPLMKEIRNMLAKKYSFSPEDMSAVEVNCWNDEFIRIMKMLDGVKIFIWIIGVFTLIAGIVGVSNIMMIVVKERTSEIGIRKALGATPLSIVMLIVQEAVFITGVAGYIGLVSGIATVQFMGNNLESDFFKNPTVSFNLAVLATIIIIVAGALAGLIPAVRASQVNPVEALRSE